MYVCSFLYTHRCVHECPRRPELSDIPRLESQAVASGHEIVCVAVYLRNPVSKRKTLIFILYHLKLGLFISLNVFNFKYIHFYYFLPFSICLTFQKRVLSVHFPATGREYIWQLSMPRHSFS